MLDYKPLMRNAIRRESGRLRAGSRAIIAARSTLNPVRDELASEASRRKRKSSLNVTSNSERFINWENAENSSLALERLLT